MLRKEKEVLIEAQQQLNLEADIARELQFRVTIPQDNSIIKERKTRHTRHEYNRIMPKVLNASDVVRKGMLLNHIMWLLTRLVLNKLTRVNNERSTQF